MHSYSGKGQERKKKKSHRYNYQQRLRGSSKSTLKIFTAWVISAHLMNVILPSAPEMPRRKLLTHIFLSTLHFRRAVIKAMAVRCSPTPQNLSHCLWNTMGGGASWPFTLWSWLTQQSGNSPQRQPEPACRLTWKVPAIAGQLSKRHTTFPPLCASEPVPENQRRNVKDRDQ